MVLVLGATGRTGGRVLVQLLDRGVPVRAIVRSAGRLPEGVAAREGLEVIEADLISLSKDMLRDHLEGCSAVVSCLGHNISFKGMYGAPRDLVTQAVERVSRVVRSMSSADGAAPLRVVLMSSVSVSPLGRREARRTLAERVFLAVIRAVIPPARDNQGAADFLVREMGAAKGGSGGAEWVVVRPDTLVEGDVSEYDVHGELVDSLFAPGKTNMSNVAHFMCELVTSDESWAKWRGGFPVIVNRGEGGA